MPFMTIKKSQKYVTCTKYSSLRFDNKIGLITIALFVVMDCAKWSLNEQHCSIIRWLPWNDSWQTIFF